MSAVGESESRCSLGSKLRDSEFVVNVKSSGDAWTEIFGHQNIILRKTLRIA